MAASYTFDIFSTLDGFGAHSGNWGGYWGKQGPEFLDRRLALYGQEQRMVFGPNTYRAHVQAMDPSSTISCRHLVPCTRECISARPGRRPPFGTGFPGGPAKKETA